MIAELSELLFEKLQVGYPDKTKSDYKFIILNLLPKGIKNYKHISNYKTNKYNYKTN